MASKGMLLVVGLLLTGFQPSWSAESQPDSLTSDRRVRSAVLRSLALPGWGQFYNGKHIKGSVIAAVELGSAVAYVVRRNQIKDLSVHTRNVYFFTTIGVVLYSMADAYVDAHLSRVNWAEVEAGVDETGAAKLRLKFKFR
ncbi:MAG: DUF5683 domain-containing protein [Candidatus Latescibacteria bacterium]|nr:DUF5683 domain-containing protein [Candidatus Latescibacterota bacterium]